MWGQLFTSAAGSAGGAMGGGSHRTSSSATTGGGGLGGGVNFNDSGGTKNLLVVGIVALGIAWVMTRK